MSFYDLSGEERIKTVETIHGHLKSDLQKGDFKHTLNYFSDTDTYIRKSAYIAIGRIYFSHKNLQQNIIRMLGKELVHDDFRVRQTVINAAGEIGKVHFEIVQPFFDQGLFDKHHSPRNAVIGSVKKMSEVNPEPVLAWAKKYLHHPNKEIRREICHGIELRGRKFPQDILPLLQQLENDKTARVRNTLVHVLGQIAYKKGCLKIVVENLKKWKNKELVAEAFLEIIDVHHRYRNFSALTQEEARRFISYNYGELHQK